MTSVHERSIASYAVDLVAGLSSDTAFTVPGGMAMYLNNAIATHPGIRSVSCQHEQACVAAAEGYAKASNFRRAGLAVVTAGPGVSNSATSLISAYGDSTPLIVLAGQIKSEDIDTFGTRTHGIQEIHSRELITPCVKTFTRLGAQDFRRQLVETLASCFSGRPGPVFIEIPLDIQGTKFQYTDEDVSYDVTIIRQQSAPLAHGSLSIANCLTKLLNARRPLLYVGNGCRIAGIEAQVCDFARRHSIPAVFSWLSFDILPATDPLHFGCPGGLAPISSNEILSHADVIVFLGARLDLGTTAFQRSAFGAQASRCFIDIDPAELAKFQGMPNAELVEADLRLFPEAMPQLKTPTSAADPGWLSSCKERRASYLKREGERLRSDALNAYNVATRLSRWSDDKVFIPASSGYAEETFSRFFAPGKNARFFNGAALGSMGLGLPHAIGASFATGRQVICLEADGGLMFNIQELATLAQHSPRGFVLFVLNNSGYESIRASQTRYFGKACGVDRESGLYIPNFAKLADAFGLRYVPVRSVNELDRLLPELGPQQDPVMVDLFIQRAEPRGPSVKTMIDENGKPYSTPLSELNW